MNQNIDSFNASILHKQDEETIDIKTILGKIINNWYLFVLGVIIFLSLSVFYAYYSSPLWNVTSKILVEDPKKGASASIGGEGASDLSALFGAKSSADNEVQILKSRSLMNALVRELNLNIRTYSKDGFKATEIYDRAPFVVNVTYKRDSIVNTPYNIDILDSQSFLLSNSKAKINIKGKFGDSILLPQYNIVFSKTNFFYPGGTYKINIQSVDDAVEALSTAYGAQLSDKQSSSIDLFLSYGNPRKGEVILDALMRIYIQSNLENKVRIADSTMMFIDERLNIVGKELGSVEKQLQQYKQENNLSDISAQSKALISSSSEYFDKLNEINVQVAVLNDLQTYLNRPDNRKVVPSSLTTKDPSFGQAINAYNEMVLNREKFKLSYTDENPVIKNVDQQIEGARQNLVKSLDTYRKGLQVSKSELTKQNSSFSGEIKSIPQKERVFLDYSRQQNLKQELYLFLMKKREETAITKTSTISSSRIIDSAKSNSAPLTPKKSMLYAVGFLIGIIVPSAFLYLKELLNIKIGSKNDIERLTNVPILGEITHNDTDKNLVVEEGSRSVISEQFRSLRTNLQFIIDTSKSNVLLFTSSMSGEGKSFLSLNLGVALALTNKKVVFIELDLRKPKLSQYMGVGNDNGFTNYVISPNPDVDTYLKPFEAQENCSLISSGPIPPNPSELLMSQKLEKLINELKQRFDYVIIDCAPIGLVTDALLVEKYADLTFYVTRQKYTYKSQFEIINDLKKTGKVKNLYLIVNDIPAAKGGYGGYGGGYGYGYGYGSYLEETKKKPKSVRY